MKNKRSFLFLLFLCISIPYFTQVTCAYKYRKRITFDPSRVSGSADLVNFPALIKIASDNNLRTVTNSGHVENTNGYDIIFTSSDGVTLLDFQLEKYTALTGQYTAWVKIPLLSTSIDTDIYMYYGNTAITTNQSSASVWTNYYGVWHYENNNFSDSSPNGYNSTNNGTTNQSPAMINDGRANNGNQWLEVASTFPNITTDYSMSAWIYTTNNAKAGQRVFCDDVSNSGGYALSIGDNGTGALRFFARSSNPVYIDSPNNTIANNTWYFVTAVADITNLTRRIFVNGVQVASDSFTGAWGTDSGNSSISGETAGGETANRLEGRIDEVRVAKSALSADWLLTEYNNQNSPATFYSVSAEPKVWTGGTSTNFSTGSNWLNGSVPGNNDDVIITNGANQPMLQANVQFNSIFIKTGATLSLSNRRLSIRTDITNCGTISGNTGEVRCNSTNAYTRNQYFSGPGSYNLTDLTVDNTFGSSPALRLSSPVTLSGDLALTSGIVYTDATNILALNTGATSNSGSAASFVSGPMSKAGTANFVFPVGKSATWRRAGVTGITASSTFKAEYFDAAFSNTTPVNSPLNNVSAVEYWQVDRIAGSGNALLALYWESAAQSGISNCPDLTIAHWNGSSWNEIAASTNVGSTCTGTGNGIVTSNAVVSSFSPFTFGSKSTGVNPLPVELLGFEAVCETNKVILHWNTASETRNDYFLIEKSPDGAHWAEAGRVKGAGTSSTGKKYLLEEELHSYEVLYYKLSQTDTDGEKEVLGIIAADCKASEENMLVYPNPATSEIKIEFDLTRNYGAGVIKVIDPLGRICFTQNLNLTTGRNSFRLPLSLTPGTYSILFSSPQLVLPAKRLLVQ